MESAAPLQWTKVGFFVGLALSLASTGSPLVQNAPAPEARGGQTAAPAGAPQTKPPLPSPATPPVKPAQLSVEDRADIFMARKKYADAVEYYTRALKQSNFHNVVVWNKLGIAYQQQQNFRRARKAYEEAIRRKQNFAEPWNNLGTAHFMDRKYKKSVRCYQRALELNPNSSVYHLNLGTSLYHLKKIEEALAEYRRALELDPNCLTERSAMATMLMAPRADVEFYFYMAKVFASLGRAEEAVRYLRRAFEDGLHDHKRLDDDPDFKKISLDPAFVELMKNPPVPIKD